MQNQIQKQSFNGRQRIPFNSNNRNQNGSEYSARVRNQNGSGYQARVRNQNGSGEELKSDTTPIQLWILKNGLESISVCPQNFSFHTEENSAKCTIKESHGQHINPICNFGINCNNSKCNRTHIVDFESFTSFERGAKYFLCRNCDEKCWKFAHNVNEITIKKSYRIGQKMGLENIDFEKVIKGAYDVLQKFWLKNKKKLIMSHHGTGEQNSRNLPTILKQEEDLFCKEFSYSNTKFILAAFIEIINAIKFKKITIDDSINEYMYAIVYAEFINNALTVCKLNRINSKEIQMGIIPKNICSKSVNCNSNHFELIFTKNEEVKFINSNGEEEKKIEKKTHHHKSQSPQICVSDILTGTCDCECLKPTNEVSKQQFSVQKQYLEKDIEAIKKEIDELKGKEAKLISNKIHIEKNLSSLKQIAPEEQSKETSEEKKESRGKNFEANKRKQVNIIKTSLENIQSELISKEKELDSLYTKFYACVHELFIRRNKLHLTKDINSVPEGCGVKFPVKTELILIKNQVFSQLQKIVPKEESKEFIELREQLLQKRLMKNSIEVEEKQDYSELIEKCNKIIMKEYLSPKYPSAEKNQKSDEEYDRAIKLYNEEINEISKFLLDNIEHFGNKFEGYLQKCIQDWNDIEDGEDIIMEENDKKASKGNIHTQKILNEKAILRSGYLNFSAFVRMLPVDKDQRITGEIKITPDIKEHFNEYIIEYPVLKIASDEWITFKQYLITKYPLAIGIFCNQEILFENDIDKVRTYFEEKTEQHIDDNFIIPNNPIFSLGNIIDYIEQEIYNFHSIREYLFNLNNNLYKKYILHIKLWQKMNQYRFKIGLEGECFPDWNTYSTMKLYYKDPNKKDQEITYYQAWTNFFKGENITRFITFEKPWDKFFEDYYHSGWVPIAYNMNRKSTINILTSLIKNHDGSKVKSYNEAKEIVIKKLKLQKINITSISEEVMKNYIEEEKGNIDFKVRSEIKSHLKYEDELNKEEEQMDKINYIAEELNKYITYSEEKKEVLCIKYDDTMTAKERKKKEMEDKKKEKDNKKKQKKDKKNAKLSNNDDEFEDSEIDINSDKESIEKMKIEITKSSQGYEVQINTFSSEQNNQRFIKELQSLKKQYLSGNKAFTKENTKIDDNNIIIIKIIRKNNQSHLEFGFFLNILKVIKEKKYSPLTNLNLKEISISGYTTNDFKNAIVKIKNQVTVRNDDSDDSDKEDEDSDDENYNSLGVKIR